MSEPAPVRRLLVALDERGSDWPSAFPELTLEGLAALLARAMSAGLVVDGALSEQGRRELARPDRHQDDDGIDVATWQSLVSPPEQLR